MESNWVPYKKVIYFLIKPQDIEWASLTMDIFIIPYILLNLGNYMSSYNLSKK